MLNYFIVNALMLIGFISIIFIIYQTGRNLFPRYPKLARVFLGILSGIAGILLMSQSFETTSGVLIGYRNYNIGIASFFGGFISAAIAAVMMFIYRVLVIGINQTTLTLLTSLTVLTVGATIISKNVPKWGYKWAYFSMLNIAVTSIALYSLLYKEQNSMGIFLYFYIGHILLSFMIYIILKLYIQFNEAYKKLAEESILNIRNHLTGLKNRNAIRILKEEFKKSEPLSGKRSVITIDIDNFRLVNDALGQHSGDQIIIDLSKKIISRIGDLGDVYHTDGDEFVVILESTDLEMIQEFSKEILQDLANQIMINNLPYFLTASIGICIGEEGVTLDQTMENAYTALYLAKKEKNSAKLYTQEMEKVRTRDAILEEDLRRALEKRQLELYFQPIYDVRKGVINQAEALLRWNHPEFGLVSPGEFIPIAERTKLILPITDWVIKQSCLKLAEWKEIGIDGIIVSVNLTFISFENRGNELTSYIINSIKEAGIDASSLKLEITESTLMRNADEIIKVFHDLKSIGVKLALDDFGTGYSSFGYMKDLPLDIMKLDRSLISDILMSEKEQMIVNSLIKIIHGLGLEVVVEGVETKEQYEKLKQYDCDFIQGFLFSRPLPVDEFVKYYRFMKENEPIVNDINDPVLNT